MLLSEVWLTANAVLCELSVDGEFGSLQQMNVVRSDKGDSRATAPRSRSPAHPVYVRRRTAREVLVDY